MKANTISYELPLQVFLAILILGMITSCTDVEIEPIDDYGEADPLAHYLGEYSVFEDNCRYGDYSILLSKYQEDVIDQPVEPPKIYISNFMDNELTPVVAQWDGEAFVAESQNLQLGFKTVNVSARVYKLENELSISYILSENQNSQSCSAKFIKQ